MTSSAASAPTPSQVNTQLRYVMMSQLRCGMMSWLRCVMMSAGTFCERRVCLKKGGCLENTEGSAASVTSHLFLLTLGLISSTVC